MCGRNGLPPTPDILYLGCSYHLHSSHRFLSTSGVVMLEKKQTNKQKKQEEKHNKEMYVLFRVKRHTCSLKGGKSCR